MGLPLVSVICLCHNHARFIRESIDSVLNQTYKPVEIIVVDDSSSDESREIIREIVRKHPIIQTIFTARNLGNCRAFNTGFSASEGKYIIDLAADDVLHPDRIRKGVELFEKVGDTFGVNFTDADYIDEDSTFIRTHYQKSRHGEVLEEVPRGDVYADLLNKYFICSPTMMIRRTVLEDLNGYDETMAYEDFDFWIRSSRKYRYCFTPESLVRKRIVAGSLSTKQYVFNSRILESTYRICLKAEQLNKSRAENIALAKRAIYEGRRSLLSGNLSLAFKFLLLLDRLSFE